MWKNETIDSVDFKKEKRGRCYFNVILVLYEMLSLPGMACNVYPILYDFTVNRITQSCVVLQPIYSQSIELFQVRYCGLIRNELKPVIKSSLQAMKW